MSRSTKKPYIKDAKYWWYWRTCRRVINEKVRDLKTIFNSFSMTVDGNEKLDEIELPAPRSIVNDYAYRDWWFISEDKKHTRK